MHQFEFVIVPTHNLAISYIENAMWNLEKNSLECQSTLSQRVAIFVDYQCLCQ